jgi:hypothetical protein
VLAAVPTSCDPEQDRRRQIMALAWAVLHDRHDYDYGDSGDAETDAKTLATWVLEQADA